MAGSIAKPRTRGLHVCIPSRREIIMTMAAELKQVKQDLTARPAGDMNAPWLLVTIRAFGVLKLLAALALCVGGTSWADDFVVPYIGTVIYAYCSSFDSVCQPPQQYGWAPLLTFETVSGADGTYAGTSYDPDGTNTLLHATLSSDFAFIPAFDITGYLDTRGEASSLSERIGLEASLREWPIGFSVRLLAS
jgi:hypothetical protein